MSTSRTTPRGPGEAAGIIAESAYKGAVVSALVVPALQIILLRIAEVAQSLPSTGTGPYAGEMSMILQSGMLALVVLPVASTIGSMILAYAFARWWGVGLYWVMSLAASRLLGADLTAAVVFAIGMVLFFVVATIKMGVFQSGSRRGPPRRRL